MPLSSLLLAGSIEARFHAPASRLLQHGRPVSLPEIKPSWLPQYSLKHRSTPFAIGRKKSPQSSADAGTEFVGHDFQVVCTLLKRLKCGMHRLSLKSRDVVGFI